MQDLHIVIIGNGIAGNSAALAIREVSKEGAITIVSQESFPQYSPCVLPQKYISGEMERREVFLKTFEDYSKQNIRFLPGQKVTGVNIENEEVLLEAGSLSYDKLIIATGSRPVVPPLEGIEREGVFTLKSLEDAERICNYTGEKVVVIGAGPMGVEVSIALKKRGWKVSLVGRRWLLPRAFGEKPSLILKKIIENYGIEVLTRETAIKMSGNTHVTSVITNKREIECDMVILALGLRPETDLAQKAGIEIGNLGGVKINKQMMTSVEDIYACGDCVQARDMVTGEEILSLLWHNAKQQGGIAGYNSAGIRRDYPGALNIRGIDILGTHAVSIGHTMDRFENTKLKIIEGGNKCYHRLLIADGILVGAQFVGKTEDMGPLLSAIRRGDSLERLQGIIRDGDLLSKNPWCYRMFPYIGC